MIVIICTIDSAYNDSTYLGRVGEEVEVHRRRTALEKKARERAAPTWTEAWDLVVYSVLCVSTVYIQCVSIVYSA
jgi:hypothetical protein